MSHKELLSTSAKEMYERIREIVAREYNVVAGAIDPDDSLDPDLDGKGDYVDIWEFLHYVGEEFNMQIPVLEIETVRELADYIWERIERNQAKTTP